MLVGEDAGCAGAWPDGSSAAIYRMGVVGEAKLATEGERMGSAFPACLMHDLVKEGVSSAGEFLWEVCPIGSCASQDIDESSYFLRYSCATTPPPRRVVASDAVLPQHTALVRVEEPRARAYHQPSAVRAVKMFFALCTSVMASPASWREGQLRPPLSGQGPPPSSGRMPDGMPLAQRCSCIRTTVLRTAM